MRMLAAMILLVVAAACAVDSSGGPVAPEQGLFAKLAGADHGGRPFSTTLTPEAEFPVPTIPEGFSPSGTFVMTLNQGQEEICYELTAEGLTTPVIGAHIHVLVDLVGPIVVPLETPTTGASSGCVSVDRALIKDIRQNPENYYVNVHTTLNPPGEIRGNLSK